MPFFCCTHETSFLLAVWTELIDAVVAEGFFDLVDVSVSTELHKRSPSCPLQ